MIWGTGSASGELDDCGGMERDRDFAGDGVANSVRTRDQGAHCKCLSAVADGGRFAIGGNGRCLARNRACVEINQCVGCTREFFTKSFLGDGAAVLARSSGEEPA